ncbi:1269_t:CDS:2, partial [Funneliformis mosseae]
HLYMPIELVNFDSADVRNFAQPILNAAVASTILNHYGFTYCNHLKQDLCGKCCLAQCAMGTFQIRGTYDCGQLIHYNDCVFGGDCVNESTIRCTGLPDGCASFDCTTPGDEGTYDCPYDNSCGV